VPTFTVVLEVVLRGATMGSTRGNVIEAEDALDAAAKAIAASQAVRPGARSGRC
jgi:hypothetical protein